MKPGHIITTTLLFSVLTLEVACGQKGQTSSPPKAPPSRVEKLKHDAKDAVTTAGDYVVQQKNQLQKNLTDKLNDFDKQLSDLKAKSLQAGDKARSQWTNTLARLQEKKRVAADKLEQLRSSSSEKWQELKAGAEKAVADVEKALQDAFAGSKEDAKSGKP